MAFFFDGTRDREFGVVRFEFWVFPCSQFNGAVFLPVHAKHKMLVEK